MRSDYSSTWGTDTDTYRHYDVWLEAIIDACKHSVNWNVLDDWAYSTKGHYGKDLNLYHLCTGSHVRYLDPPGPRDSEVTSIDDKNCVSCGDLVPDGIKMIVMLLESGI